jgi:3-hydroxybutyryl-CoA dehydratase
VTLPPGLHQYDTLTPGEHYDTASITVTPALIAAFATLTGDHHAIHLSDDAARTQGFPGQVAHGLLILSLVEGLKSASPVQLGGFAALHWDWQFRKPVLAGDTITCRVTVQAKRTAGPGRAQITLALTVTNQHGDCVQQGTTRVMAHR